RHLEDLVGDLADDLRAGVVVLVDAVTEAHEPALAGLHLLDELGDLRRRADLVQHVHDFLVRAAVTWAGEGGGRGRYARIWIGERRADDAHRAGRAVLLVVGVEDE